MKQSINVNNIFKTNTGGIVNENNVFCHIQLWKEVEQ